MILELDQATLKSIQSHGEASYPDEGAGLLLGAHEGEVRQVRAIYTLKNTREDVARHNRYLLTPQDYARGEQEAARLGWDLVGVFHSHPDHPSQPSDFDREWAMPWFSYMITSIENGHTASTRSWRLAEDRSRFEEETIKVIRKG